MLKALSILNSTRTDFAQSSAIPQRDALDGAQHALRKLAAQAHGEALSQLMEAWTQRDAVIVPSVQELGAKVSPQVRNAWVQALSKPAGQVSNEAMLRLEIASDVTSAAEDLSARRMLQLQLLTRRNQPTPQETWPQDVATVLAGAHDEVKGRRLQHVLKQLLRKNSQ